jgi:very-short-patch-repair endonuclease
LSYYPLFKGGRRKAAGGFLIMKLYNKNLKPLARELRNNQTDPELVIWHYIRKKQILNVTFNRQKPLYNYILDFYSDKARLAIEIDGAGHFTQEQQDKDMLRDEILLISYNIKTIRFTNREVFNSLPEVLNTIYVETEARLKSPPPLCVDPL